MSQRIKIANIDIKEGDNEKGHWRNFTITGEDKVKASTFDSLASSLKVGDIIEAEIELKGKFSNIKSFKKIESDEIAPEPLGASRDELKKPKQIPYDREQNIAEAVAVKAVIDLLCAKVINLDHPLAGRAFIFLTHHLPTTSTLDKSTLEPSKEGIGKIDPVWLKETLEIIKWSEQDTIKWMAINLKMPVKKTLGEMLTGIPAEKLQTFSKKLADLREASGQ